MPVRICLLALALVSGLSVAGFDRASTAQPHPGGILMGAGYPLPTDQNFIQGHHIVDWRTGGLSTFVDTVAGPGKPNYFWGSTVDVDNRSLVFGTAGHNDPRYNMNFGVYRYDPATTSYSTLAFDPAFQTVFGVVPDEDGDYYVTARSLGASFWHLFKLDGRGGFTTVLSTIALGRKLSFHYPVHRDVDTGAVLLPTSGTISPGLVEHPIYLVHDDGSVTTFNWSPHGMKPSWGWTQEIATGDCYYQFANELFRVSKGTTPQFRVVTLHAPLSPEYAYGIVYDNQAQANPQIIAYSRYQRSHLSTANLRWIDPQQNFAVTRTVNIIQASQFAPIPYPHRHIAQYATRYIHTLARAPRVRDVNFAFPTRPNMAYAVAVSASGVRPGITLGDGRRVWLNPDGVLYVTLANLIPAIWSPGPGTLDANGRATGRLDTSALGSLGITVHIVAAVLDPAAPLGLAFVTEPFPVRL